MLVLSGREFGANPSKYFGAARNGEDVVVKSKTGNFRIVPIEDDMVDDEDSLTASLYRSLKQVKQAREGKAKLLSWEEFQHEMER